MISRTSTRAVVLVATLFCLVLGGFAAVPPPASAAGEVTVVWPEITAFNPDTTDYVIDVQWDGTGTLWLHGLGEFRDFFDEITSPGANTVDFPIYDQSGWRKLSIWRCTAEGFDHQCLKVADSPLLDVTRSAVSPAEPSAVSVEWPAITGFNPDTGSYVPEIEWDGRGSLFLLHRYGGFGDFGRYDEIHQAGPYAVDLPVEGAGDTWDLAIASCPGAVFEFEYCTRLGQRLDIGVWRALDIDFGVTAVKAWGPTKSFPVQVATPIEESIEASWQVLDHGAVAAEGTSTFHRGDPLPALGVIPQLVDGHEYEVVVSVAAETDAFGLLTGADSVPIRWDSQNLSEPTTGACCAFVEGADEFFPTPDGYLDTFEFRSPRSTESVAMNVVIRDHAGVAVFDGDATRLPDRLQIAWDGRDETGAIVPEGDYLAEVSITDAVGNIITHERGVRVSRRAIVQKTLRIQVGVDESRFARARVGCGRLVRPARAEWPGSVGYYTPDECRADALYSIGTRHRVELPSSFTGMYGDSRITVVGGKSRLEKKSRLRLEHYGEVDPDLVTYGEGIDGNTGPHVGSWTQIHPRTFEGMAGDYLTWGVRAGLGSRYDVRRFIVEVEYDVLE